MRPEATPDATYEDLKALPENLVGELIGGTLYASPRPALRHAQASSVLGGELIGPFGRGRGGPGGWWILDEPELHFSRDVIVPDLAGWLRERLPTIPDEPFLTLAPDWVCEVISPSTASLDRVKKKHVYAREGVPHLWLLDPIARVLEAYRLQDGSWLELGSWGGNDCVRVPPFEAIELELHSLWSED